MKKSSVILWMLVYIYAILIFYFSSLSVLPRSITIVPDYIGHFIEYLFFGFLVFLAIKNTEVLNKNTILNMVIFIGLFALSDELHQSFVSNRFFELKDLAIDFVALIPIISVKDLFKS